MAQGDYRIQSVGGNDVAPSRKYSSEDRDTSALTRTTRPGEPVKTRAEDSQYLIP